ncbi:hypothetical protein [Saccharopolyspora gregorii]|uniref:Uncharacterized protein n=1 Tax=Saccharopolyspora gregorii TaxID=33914 RepID=A0ABP6RRC4_9PSEU|nr:hypothetical protein [Saccharopolyspora gregorii]
MPKKKFLPMTWVFARTPAGRSYTFRWGRGEHVMTVHSGDRRGSHDDEHLLDTVHTGGDWDDDEDVRVLARKWLRCNDELPERPPPRGPGRR